jgi:hypothetical protein
MHSCACSPSISSDGLHSLPTGVSITSHPTRRDAASTRPARIARVCSTSVQSVRRAGMYASSFFHNEPTSGLRHLGGVPCFVWAKRQSRGREQSVRSWLGNVESRHRQSTPPFPLNGHPSPPHSQCCSKCKWTNSGILAATPLRGSNLHVRTLLRRPCKTVQREEFT